MRLSPLRVVGTSAIAAALLSVAGSAVSRPVNIPFRASNFSQPLAINNPLFPLRAGTTFVYHANTDDGGCEVDRFEVTAQTRVLAGVTTRVVHDVVSVGATCSGPLQVTEDTLDYHAQDNSGNVWYFGEDTSDCTPAGCTPGEGTWHAGVNGALPGIIMLANPMRGDSYDQESASGSAEDHALVLQTGAIVRLTRPEALPPKIFGNCVITRESTPLDPGNLEQKSYCTGIGQILTVEARGSVRSELVAIERAAATIMIFR